MLELFTSQGCSSCPPADALLGQLAADRDIVALAYHVDYWDYIGWTDTFGHAAFSDYQRAYAAGTGNGRIYTPQLVVNGGEGVVGSRADEVAAALKVAALPLPVDLSVEAGTLRVDIAGRPGGKPAMIWLVTFIGHAEVSIERGENRGSTIGYTNIVTGRQMLGVWDPAAGTHLMLPLDKVLARGSTGLAVLVQDDKRGLPGIVHGAAALSL